MSKQSPLAKKNIKKEHWIRRLLPLFTILISVLLFAFLIDYTENFRATLLAETHAYMDEIAEQVTLVMNQRIDSNIKNLETDAVAILQINTEDPSAITTFLQEEANRYGYTNMALADVDGKALEKDGQTVIVSNRKHFIKALRGEPAVSELITPNYGRSESVEFAVPIIQNDQVHGVLLANYNLSDFRDIFNVNIFNGEGAAMVIDPHGIVIVSSQDTHTYNFFTQLMDSDSISEKSYQQFTQNILEGTEGTLDYAGKTDQMLLHYQSLGINGWMLLVSSPTNQISGKTNLFLEGMMYISIFIALLVSSLMLIIIVTQSKNRRTLEDLLYVDPVTGGISYTKFIMEAKKRLTDKDKHYLILQFNLEKFKLINTTFGHEKGDRLLRYVDQTIAGCLAPHELITRASADRFCLLLKHDTQEAVIHRVNFFAERINRFNDQLSEKYFLHFNAGVRLVDNPQQDIAMLYEQANFSRTHGASIPCFYGKIAFYDELERNLILHEKELENRMDHALAQGEFHTFIQPKYELNNNTICGGEALVRWIIPEKGMMNPGEFIPLFERNGFIVEIDLYMFDQVCRFQQRRWDLGLRCVPISVNLSRKHLEKMNFLQSYKDIFSQYSFPPHLLEIELTESIVFNNMDRLIKVIEELHNIGFSCSMDDFGSGYSSLNMLKEIPVDILKLDRAFFYSTSGDMEKSHFVIENIINLAGKLQMKTVSEGIEHMEQVHYLRSVNCDMVQGYVFARPMSQDQFELLLEKEPYEKNQVRSELI